MRRSFSLIVLLFPCVAKAEFVSVAFPTTPEQRAVAQRVYLNASDGDNHDHPGQWHGIALQDRVVASLFQFSSKGFFVDLAANAPVRMSNTRALERDLGWHGICIEPNELLISELARRRTCQLVSAVVSDRAGRDVTFNTVLGFDAISGVEASKETPSRWIDWLFGRHSGSDSTIRQHKMTVALADVLRGQQAPNVIEYLSLDVEGHEHEVLKSFPFSSFTFLAISFETNYMNRPENARQVRRILSANNYSYARHLDDGPLESDELWLHVSIRHKLHLILTSSLNCAQRSCRKTSRLDKDWRDA